MEVISEEEYLYKFGYGMSALGDQALHRMPGLAAGRAKREKLIQRQADKDRQWQETRIKLRKDYQAKKEEGLLRAPTRHERLIAIARGHEDLESTQAARRLLSADAINWKLTRDQVGDRDLLRDLRSTTPDVLVTNLIADGWDEPADSEELPHTDGFGCQAVEWFEKYLQIKPGYYPRDPQEQIDTEILDGDVCIVRVSPYCTTQSLGIEDANGGYHTVHVDDVDFELKFSAPQDAVDVAGDSMRVVFVKAAPSE